MFPLFGQLDFVTWCLLRFLLKRVIKDDQSLTMYKTKDSEYVASNLNSDLPYSISIYEFLKILNGYVIQFFNKLEYPGYLLSLFAL